MKFKNTVSFILAAVLCVSALTGCGETYDPLDQVYTNDREQITARQLLEGSDEQIRYASYLRVTGDLTSDYSPVGQETTNKLEFEGYYKDKDNYSNVLTGTFKLDSIVSMFHSEIAVNSVYEYYVGKTGGAPVEGFNSSKNFGGGMAVAEWAVKVDVKRVILPDVSAATVVFDGKISNNKYVIRLTGDLSYLDRAFSGMDGSNGINEVTYYFSADTHVLQEVYVRGRTVETQKILDREVEHKKDFSARFKIEEISYKDHGVYFPFNG
jgi:hypothetical protein